MVPPTHDAIVTFIPIFAAFGLKLLIAEKANVSNMMLASAARANGKLAFVWPLGAGRCEARSGSVADRKHAASAVPAALLGFAISQVTVEGGGRRLCIFHYRRCINR